jgi:hypothetical protein
MVAVVLLMPEVASAEGSVGVQYAMRDRLTGGLRVWFPNAANLRWYIHGGAALELAMADFETGALAANDALGTATKRSLLPITLGAIVRTRSPVYLAFGSGFARDHISYQVGHPSVTTTGSVARHAGVGTSTSAVVSAGRFKRPAVVSSWRSTFERRYWPETGRHQSSWPRVRCPRSGRSAF